VTSKQQTMKLDLRKCALSEPSSCTMKEKLLQKCWPTASYLTSPVAKDFPKKST